MPGPACYGRGGTEPTITDCNVVLGYLGEDNFLGGKMKLDSAAARRAVETNVAKKLSLSVEDAAEGIVRIIDVKMQEAIKAISTMRGHDLSRLSATGVRRRGAAARRAHRQGARHGGCRRAALSRRLFRHGLAHVGCEARLHPLQALAAREA